MMKRSLSPGNDAGPSQKRPSKKRRNECKRCDDQVDTVGKVIWSGTVQSHDSQKIVFDCSMKAYFNVERMKSVFSSKQLNIHILPNAVMHSLNPHEREKLGGVILCTDENTDMVSSTAFFQAISFDRSMVGLALLGETASSLHLLFVWSLYEHEIHIFGYIRTYQTNDNVLEILRSHGLLHCANPEHKELAKQIARLKEELQCKDKMLVEQQRLNQEQVKMHKEQMKEKERKHEEERNIMEEQITQRDETIATLNRNINDMQCVQREILSNFECSICLDTLIKPCTVSPCEHVFCESCINYKMSLRKKVECAYCRSCSGLPVPCIAIERIIDKMIDCLGNEAREDRNKAVQVREESIREGRFLALPSGESEGESTTSHMSEGESTTSYMSDGESRTSEEEEVRVPEDSGRVRDAPRESLTDSSSEESSSEAVVGERMLREQQETGTASIFPTLPTSLHLSPPSSEDEPTLS